EFQVTPLQLAAAYAAIANDGILLSPSLIREIRSPDGTTLYRHHPEPIRRAVTPEVARKLRGFLREAAGEEGTGSRAQLAGFTTLGKTGTAKQLVNGRYGSQYAASFASIFPAEEPQLVTLVKLDNPAGHYYGGQTAAPVTRDLLVQAMASDRVALDRARIGDAPVAERAAPISNAETDPALAAVPWPLPPDSSPPRRNITVPDVSGTTVREAALQLHRRGFRVSLHGLGTVQRTAPANGDSLPAGAIVTVWAGEPR
ncbi:MAG: penicillin-binding transpeptidase domain-containing protein, partial [Gemmatimonadales bacterium]